MTELKEFDLDLKVKKATKKGIEPAARTQVYLCTPACKTFPLMCRSVDRN